MTVKLKHNILIEGFISEQVMTTSLNSNKTLIDVLYSGKTSDVPDAIAEKYCDWMFWDEKPDRRRYYNYGNKIGISFPYLHVSESIKSACNGIYCVIFKIK